MKLILKNNKIVGVGGDGYQGSDAIDIPENFNLDRAFEYVYDGENFVLPSYDTYFVYEIQERLDSFAKLKGYSSIENAVSYINSSKEVYRTEANTAIHLRDETWDALFEVHQQMKANTLQANSFSDIVGLLPTLSWPE